jgi:L-2-hydroxyglutarate oxidase LhgO
MMFDVTIVGGGIVGLATAHSLGLRQPGLRLAVLEKEAEVAAHQTGHNSGVIHAGIYYRPGSLRARLCVEGARRMVAFCREHDLQHEVCGKVIVATKEEELPALAELLQRGKENGVPGLAELGPEGLRRVEPHAAGIRALHVPGTGIADYAAVARKLAELAGARGTQVLTATRFTGLRRVASDELLLLTSRGEVQTRYVAFCGGLYSDRLARRAGAKPEGQVVPFRGEYYVVKPAHQYLVRGLIYPVPDPRFPFLGVHFTRTVQGGVEAGPNAVLALCREGYRWSNLKVRDLLETLAFPGFRRLAGKYWRTGVGEMYRSLCKPAFVHALQRLVPEIRAEHLTEGGSGVRAQAVLEDGAIVDDFRIVRQERAIHVLNAPSPAATSSLGIGDQVARMVEEMMSSHAKVHC